MTPSSFPNSVSFCKYITKKLHFSVMRVLKQGSVSITFYSTVLPLLSLLLSGALPTVWVLPIIRGALKTIC